LADRKNILFLSSWYPHKADPTLGIFIKRHAEAVHLKNNVVIIYVKSVEHQNTHFDTNIISDNGVTGIMITYHKSKKMWGLRHLINWSRFYIGHQLGWRAVSVMGFKPDMMHVNVTYPAGIIAWIWSKTRRLPYVISEHWTGYLPEDNRYKDSRIQQFLSKFIVGGAKEVVTVSGGLKEAMRKHGLKNEYRIIPNVVDTNFFYYNTPMENRKHYFVVVADLYDKQKNISGTILAFRHLVERFPQAELIIIGAGRDETSLKQLTFDLQIDDNIKFLGVQAPVEVRNYMQQALATILFSNFENQPCVIAESFACGTPVIATDVGGIKEHLLDAHGYLINANDGEALLNAMQKIIRHKAFDPHLIRQYAIEHFSSNVIGSKLNDLYQKHI
jgi:glycosyltransferase involved in cell wall biosynthesis